MNTFNILTEANYRHRQSVQAARERQRSRRHATAFRSRVRTVAIDATLVGVILMACVVLLACAVS